MGVDLLGVRRSLIPTTELALISIPPSYQFTLASAVYFTLSRLFPAHEMMLDHAILEQETLPDDGSYYGGDGKKDHSRVDHREARAA